MKKFTVFLFCFLLILDLFAAPKKEYDDYAQIIINDSTFTAKISLLNEETHFYEEYEIPPNEIVRLDQRLYIQGRPVTKKMIIKSPYIYIASYKFVTIHECVYLLKSIKKNVNQHLNDEELEMEEDDEDFMMMQEDDDDVLVVNENVTENENLGEVESDISSELINEFEVKADDSFEADVEEEKVTEQNEITGAIEENNPEEKLEAEIQEEYYVDENFIEATVHVEVDEAFISTDSKPEEYPELILPEIIEAEVVEVIPEPESEPETESEIESEIESAPENIDIPEPSYSEDEEDEILDLRIY